MNTGTLWAMPPVPTLPPAVALGGDKPAPVPLLLVQSFLNTWDWETGTDLLRHADTARAWLEGAGLVPAGATLDPADLEVARSVREALRAIVGAHTDGTPPARGELAPLEDLVRGHRPRLEVDASGCLGLRPEGDGLGDGLLGILLVVRDAQEAGTWARLKACGNPQCRWAFFDRSHSRRGVWCEMATCGNVMKNRTFRARHR